MNHCMGMTGMMAGMGLLALLGLIVPMLVGAAALKYLLGGQRLQKRDGGPG